MGVAPLCAVVLSQSGRGRDYLPSRTLRICPDDDECLKQLATSAVSPPDELAPDRRHSVLLVLHHTG